MRHLTTQATIHLIMDTVPSFTPMRRKLQQVDYATTETTPNQYQTHLCDSLTQTTLAGHKDGSCSQIFNPPRDPPKKRKKNQSERNERRKRDKKKLIRTPEEQLKLEEARRTGNGEDEEGDGKGTEIEDEDGSDDSNENRSLNCRDHGYSTPPVTFSPITQPPRRAEQLLNALRNVRVGPEMLEETRKLISGQLILLRKEQEICQELEGAMNELQITTSTTVSEINALQEGLVNEQLDKREWLIKRIGVLRAQLWMMTMT